MTRDNRRQTTRLESRDDRRQVTPVVGHRSSVVLRASEIGQYVYCARAWWLGNVMGAPSSNVREMAHGEAVHRQHGQAVWWAGALRVIAIGFVVLAVVAIVLSLF